MIYVFFHSLGFKHYATGRVFSYEVYSDMLWRKAASQQDKKSEIMHF